MRSSACEFEFRPAQDLGLGLIPAGRLPVRRRQARGSPDSLAAQAF
jgi:hypothetical protein